MLQNSESIIVFRQQAKVLKELVESKIDVQLSNNPFEIFNEINHEVNFYPQIKEVVKKYERKVRAFLEDKKYDSVSDYKTLALVFIFSQLAAASVLVEKEDSNQEQHWIPKSFYKRYVISSKLYNKREENYFLGSAGIISFDSNESSFTHGNGTIHNNFYHPIIEVFFSRIETFYSASLTEASKGKILKNVCLYSFFLLQSIRNPHPVTKEFINCKNIKQLLVKIIDRLEYENIRSCKLVNRENFAPLPYNPYNKTKLIFNKINRTYIFPCTRKSIFIISSNTLTKNESKEIYTKYVNNIYRKIFSSRSNQKVLGIFEDDFKTIQNYYNENIKEDNKWKTRIK